MEEEKYAAYLCNACTLEAETGGWRIQGPLALGLHVETLSQKPINCWVAEGEEVLELLSVRSPAPNPSKK